MINITLTDENLGRDEIDDAPMMDMDEAIAATTKMMESNIALEKSLEAQANIDSIEATLKQDEYVTPSLEMMMGDSLAALNIESNEVANEALSKLDILKRKLKGNHWRLLKMLLTDTQKVIEIRKKALLQTRARVVAMQSKLKSGMILKERDDKKKDVLVKGETYPSHIIDQIVNNNSKMVETITMHFANAMQTRTPMMGSFEFLGIMTFNIRMDKAMYPMYIITDNTKKKALKLSKKNRKVVDVCGGTKSLAKNLEKSKDLIDWLMLPKHFKIINKQFTILNRQCDRNVKDKNRGNAKEVEMIRRILMAEHRAIPTALAITIRGIKNLTGLPLMKDTKAKKK